MVLGRGLPFVSGMTRQNIPASIEHAPKTRTGRLGQTFSRRRMIGAVMDPTREIMEKKPIPLLLCVFVCVKS